MEDKERITTLEFGQKMLSEDIAEVKKKINTITENHLPHIQQAIDDIPEKIAGKFVSKERFLPIEKIVYGLVGLVLTSVFVALLALILK